MSSEFIPYGRQVIDQADIDAVVEVLKGDWLTTGPAVDAFEVEFASYVGAGEAVAVSNGTAALHLCMLAAGIGPGDEVIVPALTFVASANAARFVGADVVFADVDEEDLTIDVGHVASLVTARTKAIVAVDFAGLPCRLDELLAIAHQHGIALIEDACHAPGAIYRGRRVGSIATMTAFSFHPVKHMTTGEGGMVTTNDPALAGRVRMLRNHGIDADFRHRESAGTWEYDMVELGYNYRLPDLNCALGLSQLRRADERLKRRRELVAAYNDRLAEVEELRLPVEPDGRQSAWHLYPVRVGGPDAARRRTAVFQSLRRANIGVNVHYKPVHLHTYYAQLGHRKGECPVAEAAYDGLLSLPMWAGLTDEAQARVVNEIDKALQEAGT